MLRAHRLREGFTLLELLFVLVIFGIVGAATMRILVQQQRYYASANEMISMRATLRDAAAVLPTDLRGISSAGNDIIAMSDSAIDFRQATGQALVCSIGVGRTTVVVPPPVLASRSAISSWINAPVSGDQAFFYAEGPTSRIADDTWQLVTIAAPTLAGVCPTTSGYTGTAVESAAALTITVAPALQADVVVGSLIRFTKRAKYKLYQPVAGGPWYLGYLDCPGGVCGAMEAVAGPYMAYSANPAITGLRFVYRDVNGAITNVPTSVARIDIVARAQTPNPIRMPGERPLANYGDSVVVTVALRNRS